MSRIRLDPTQSTVKHLFAVSGNRCAFPECKTPIYDTELKVTLGEIAHIHGPSPDSPRHNPDLDDEQCRSYENLILLCPTHHSLVDQREDLFTDQLLQQWKAMHEKKLDNFIILNDVANQLLRRYQLSGLIRTTVVGSGKHQWHGVDSNGTQFLLSPEQAQEEDILFELSLEMASMPQSLPTLPSFTDESSRNSKLVKIYQLMLKIPFVTFGEFLARATTKSTL